MLSWMNTFNVDYEISLERTLTRVYFPVLACLLSRQGNVKERCGQQCHSRPAGDVEREGLIQIQCYADPATWSS